MSLKSKNKNLTITIVLVVFTMLALAYASVPLYSLFCKSTGFGGTPKISDNFLNYTGKKKIRVTFDANTDASLPWNFRPEQSEVTVTTGENVLIFYEAENYSSEDIVGTAVYNVIPDEAGSYFNKVECFCFSEQLLKAGEKVSMPVSFFIDPEIENDPIFKNLSTITLSYSFFRSAR